MEGWSRESQRHATARTSFQSSFVSKRYRAQPPVIDHFLSAPLRQLLQTQVDSLQHKVYTGARAFAALATQHEQISQRF